MESETQKLATSESLDILATRTIESEGSELSMSELAKRLAEDIINIPGDRTRLISLVGGAASGKTTLSIELVDSLRQQGIAADSIGTDDYVIGDREYRRTHLEGKEPKAKYDFGYMNKLIDTIVANHGQAGEVAVPTYNQATGVAIAEGEANYQHKIASVEALIIEGDFPEVAKPDLTIYLHVDDNLRLSNRLNRDLQHRSATDAAKIEENFNQRQALQHVPYTLPAAALANIVVVGHVVDGQWKYTVYR